MQNPTIHKVEFSGNARSYFGIWIVNILLSIVTLGIYSAWAKVRTRRYMYQHTAIDGRRFDYHATGMQIFIGRLIVVAGFIVFSIVSAIPIIGLVAIFGLLFLAPWLINRGMLFNARVTSWSGLRFGFDGSYWRAFRVYILYPFLSLFTLYLAIPFAIRAQHSYSVNSHRFGTAKFHFESSVKPFYVAFLLAIGWMALAGLLMFLVLGGGEIFAEIAMAERTGRAPDDALMLRMGIFYVLLILAVLPAGFIYQAFLRNAVYGATSLAGGHEFRSDVKPMQLVWIGVSNAVAIICSLGMLLPWAHIRMMRYLSDHTFILANGSLDDFTGQQEESVGAIGDAYADLEGFDVGLPV
ncbi:YjgN family protein [Actibacterium ureilyticum]|uniref:YjgN family protein n=1 Tax=Actibacterium ureilyticum TaxID=1590614 RepID=UPI000BAB0000|nr:YjgN family protein [Actibacterium ureilyticum]